MHKVFIYNVPRACVVARKKSLHDLLGSEARGVTLLGLSEEEI